MNEPRWQYLDHRALPDGGEVVYHWRMDYAEPYCADSNRVLPPGPDARCLDHDDAAVPCRACSRTPECQHRALASEDPPICGECGQTGEDVTAELAAGLR